MFLVVRRLVCGEQKVEIVERSFETAEEARGVVGALDHMLASILPAMAVRRDADGVHPLDSFGALLEVLGIEAIEHDVVEVDHGPPSELMSVSAKLVIPPS